MPQLTERDAEKLSPEQATALVRVIELQAKWDSLLANKSPTASMSELQARQKANDAFLAALRDYSSKHRNAGIPEPTQGMPNRLVVWCRTLRIVFGKAGSGNPVEVMAKVYRLTDRIAERMNKEKVARTLADDLPGAVLELDVIIAWCEALVPLTPLLKLKKGEAA